MTIPKEVKPKWTETAKSVKPYAGSAKFGDLENWLMGICVNYAMAQLGGEDWEQEKVLLLMEYLSDLALKWYLQYVLQINQAQEYWTFEDVILGLYD